MLKVYLAARYGRRTEMLDYAMQLKAKGHQVVSKWIDGHHELASEHGAQADIAADDRERAGWALEDLCDLQAANCAIVFTHVPNGIGRERGGYNVELGWVIGYNDGARGWGAPWGIRLIVVGPRVNVFHSLDLLDRQPALTEHYDNWTECLTALEAG
ncbi:MAG: hypothetical protein V2A73_12470 [Pseudomonadota bacterium]